MTIGWTQMLCDPCYAAWEVGAGHVPREPHRLTDPAYADPCLICGQPALIPVRIDPEIGKAFEHAKEKDDD